MMPRILAMGAILLALAVPDISAADSSRKLAEAREHLDQLDYDGALRVLQDALSTGKGTPGEMRSIYRMLGEVHAALGHKREAERFFRSWLSLEPQAKLPAGVSPKISQPFVEARTYMREHEPLDVRCTADAERSAMVVEVSSDPLGLVRGAQARYRVAKGSERTVESTGRGTLMLILPVEQRAEVVCAAMDEHGNHLVTIGSWDRPLELVPAAAPVRDEGRGGFQQQVPSRRSEPQSRSFFGQWYVWSSVAVVAGGAGGYFALQARADQQRLEEIRQNSAMYQYSEVQAVEQRGQRNALLANISLGVAGVSAVATVVTLLRSSGSEPSGVAVAPQVSADGGGVWVWTRF